MGHFIPTTSTPTSTLPPLNGLAHHTLPQITHALQGLRNIYGPERRSVPKLRVPKRSISCLIHDDSVPDSGYASAEEDEEDVTEEVTVCMCLPETTDASLDPLDLDSLRSDPFERAFVIKWLTGFIARSDTWIASSLDENDADQRGQAVDAATAILCAFSGNDDADAALTRPFVFPTLASREVRVELNDAPLSSDDHTSVGLQSWASSIILAKMVCATPREFGLNSSDLRVLELGAGTGLLSIVVGKLMEKGANWTIVATDYHPDVLGNLMLNIHTNFSSSPVDVHVLDWEHPVYSTPFDGPFDVILAADVIYHPNHARWIKGCIERLLRRPTGPDLGGVFWLIIPVRLTGRHEGMHGMVDKVFPSVGAGSKLVVLEKVEVGKQEDFGRADECGYKLFKIGWDFQDRK